MFWFDAKKINIWDIIFYKKLYKTKNKTIKLVHRIDEVWLCRTKGDASNSPDEFVVYSEEVVGIYPRKIGKVGYSVVYVRKLLGKVDGTS